MTPSTDIHRLLDIMAALRDPESGCPWDVRQTFETIAAYTIEEAYEVVDAIRRQDLVDLKDELGDLLLQVVFHARMAEEQGRFSFADVVEAVTRKLIRRHPHVFGDAGHLPVEEVNRLWDRIKQEEREERLAARVAAGIVVEEPGFLGGIAEALPALARAQKLTARAAKVGFDWPETGQVVAKIHEELEEVREAAEANDPDRLEDEVGDLLFAATNLARHHGIDPEKALRRTNAKFERRFKAIEDGLARAGSSLDRASLDEMERLWVEAKGRDRSDIKP